MRRFLIIGLGKFGFYMAKALFEYGNEVIAIDKDQEIVQEIQKYSTQAIVADATDKDLLLDLGAKDVDVAIVSTGMDMEASILITLYLKEIGVKEIVAKATSEDHGKILEKIGATEVIFPERDMALRVAKMLNAPRIFDHLPLAPGYSIWEIAAPKAFAGKTISQLKLRTSYNIQLIAIRQLVPDEIQLVLSPEYRIKESDILIIMGRDEDLERIRSLQ